MSYPYKHDISFELPPEGVHYMCSSCGAEMAPNVWHNCPGATHKRIQELEQRVAALEAWIKQFQELNR